ncbi:hypothetical protein F7734_21175 [Scytonema sp. UIC 10036]|uniref:hypothetical protein n=1 Tax=Scytonema sp. UIC 10036 TaxID=2304196 RepID=UPI0012DA7832|nr:hypothetical protein [Scytonema sp. UIC 10036]MUG94740.1 hypothetical protein [Scytonema sp. UIC 10036]
MGIGHWALGIGHWALHKFTYPSSPRSQVEPGNARLGGSASCNTIEAEPLGQQPTNTHSQPQAGNEEGDR